MKHSSCTRRPFSLIFLTSEQVYADAEGGKSVPAAERKELENKEEITR